MLNSHAMKAKIFSNSLFSNCHRHRRCSQTIVFNHRAKSFVVKARTGGAYDSGDNIVDENMIVLRMRIKEMKVDGLPPTGSESWMEWEKKYYEQYIRDVCEAMRMLQTCLMNNRPSLVLGTLVLLMVSATFSGSVVIHSFISFVRSFE